MNWNNVFNESGADADKKDRKREIVEKLVPLKKRKKNCVKRKIPRDRKQ